MKEIINLDAGAIRSLARDLALADAHEEIVVRIPRVAHCPNRMVPLLAIVDDFRARGKRVSVDGFNVLDVQSLNPVTTDVFGHVWRFTDYRDQYAIVDAVEKALMRIPALGAGFRVGFSWCLNEVMDNVLNHSAGVDGCNAHGYVMVQYADQENLLKVCVFDLGIGLKNSFDSSAQYHPEDSASAIRLAVRASVTSGNGQGNGLWGLHELVRQSADGRLLIKSGDGKYLYRPKEQIESAVSDSPIPGFDGTTLVDFQFVSNDSLSIDDVFPSTCRTADRWLETNEIDSNKVLLKVVDCTAGCGSRGSGRGLRTMVENVIDNDRHRVVLDFDGISSCSSSFVDELIGKLVEKYGFFAYSQNVSIVNASGISERLINHSMSQRMARHDLFAADDEVGASGPIASGGDVGANISLSLPSGESRAPSESGVPVEGKVKK